MYTGYHFEFLIPTFLRLIIQGPPRRLGQSLWICYQIANAVIIMNLLIALINATIAGIQADKITYWRFARTEVDIMLPSSLSFILAVFRFGRNTLIKNMSMSNTSQFHLTFGRSSWISYIGVSKDVSRKTKRGPQKLRWMRGLNLVILKPETLKILKLFDTKRNSTLILCLCFVIVIL